MNPSHSRGFGVGYCPRRSDADKSVRGFTLLELVTGSVVILAIAAVCLAVLVTVTFTQKEAQIRNATTRDAQLLLDTVGEDLKYFGVGVPFAANVQGAFGDPTTNLNVQLRPALRIAEEHYLAFIGDAPYPNADFNGITSLQDMAGDPSVTSDDGANSNRFAVASELSGCVPGTACDTSKMSVAFGGAGPDGCNDANAHDTPSASPRVGRTCPWGLSKWQNNASGFVDLVVSAPNGLWALLRYDVQDPAAVSPADRGQLMFTADLSYPTAGASQLRRRPFVDSSAGTSTIAQLDRIFYSAEAAGGVACGSGPGQPGCVLMRRQCFGPLGDPGFVNFPRAGTSSTTNNLLSGDAPGNCGAPNNGTPWEPVSGGITEFRFAYFDATDTLIPTPVSLRADLERVASIEVFVTVTRFAPTMSRPGDPPKALSQSMSRRFYLQNHGPFVDQHPPCTGLGCTFTGNP